MVELTRGPFEITPEGVARLGAGFTDAVNRLLQAEAASAGLTDSSLVLNRVETITDGGVDAVIRDTPVRGNWIPEGESVWQFKRSNLTPKQCADEFARATWAHSYLKGGAHYVVVLGVALSDKLIAGRKKAIVEKAVELGVLGQAGAERVCVYDANSLARWISLFPSLAVSRGMGGPGAAAVGFAEWSASRLHQLIWTPDEHRDGFIETLRTDLLSPGVVEIRVQGDRGVGKTRLALEALRHADLEPLVAYVADASEIGGELLEHLIGGGRSAVLVVDECPADQHASLAARLPNDPRIKLITIGPPGPVTVRRPVMAIERLKNESVEKLLSANFARLSTESRRFVVDHANGNPRWAEVLAFQVLNASDVQAAELIVRNDIEQFVSDMLPQGRDFLIATGLALFDRVGWNQELTTERELLAEFLGVSTAEIQGAAAELEVRGLLGTHGRYRAIGPHPLAVFLASRIWERDGQRVVLELLGELSESMTLSLFRRLADLGRFGPAQRVLAGLLGSEGPFKSLEEMEVSGTTRLLTQLAIVLPTEVTRQLLELVEATSEDQLRELTGVRRDLVWTLEKLAWHSNTFETAANCLLKLAIAENESYGNNATGAWKSMFGTMLPATAASPDDRMSYLSKVARSDDERQRLLVVEALSKAINFRRESSIASGELQGGVLVQPRGKPNTQGEAWNYQLAAIDQLAALSGDEIESVRSKAAECLIKSIHNLAGRGKVWDKLEQTLEELPMHHRAVRLELTSVQALRRRGPGLADSKEKVEQRERVIEAMTSLERRLRPPSPEESLELALSQRRWALKDGELQDRVLAAMKRYHSAQPGPGLIQMLETEMYAAWEFGAGLAAMALDPEMALQALVDAYDVNPLAIRGYLVKRTQDGEVGAVESFLESPLVSALSDAAQLELTSLAEPTESLRRIADDLIARLPTAEAVARVPPAGDDAEVLRQLSRWSSRLHSQVDYNAVVDWLWVAMVRREKPSEAFREAALALVLRRGGFPDMGRESSYWCHIAAATLPENEVAIAGQVLDLMEDDELIVIGHDEESQILSDAFQADTEAVWEEIAHRLEAGSWRIETSIRRWLLQGIEPAPIRDWISEDIDRARIVARIAPVGSEEPTPIARHLLTEFWQDDEVSSSLFCDIASGSWVGNQSDRIESQIDQLNAWRDNKREPPSVRRWAGDVVHHLMLSKEAALTREAERDF